MTEEKRARRRRQIAFIKQHSSTMKHFTGMSRKQARHFARVEWDRALSLERKSQWS